MVVAGLRRDLAFDQPARRLEIQHGDLGLEQRGVDEAAFAGALALQERHHDPLGQEAAGREIGDRDADPHRALTRQAGDRHQPAHALGDLVDAGAIGVGSVLAEAQMLP